jgi:hypothetical protein
MNESSARTGLDGKQPTSYFNPPKWRRVGITAVPFAIFAEAIAILIAIEPHPKLPTMQVWGITFCLCIPAPLIWLRNGNRHLRDFIATKAIDPALSNLIAYFSVGVITSCYLIVALLIGTLYLALKLAR